MKISSAISLGFAALLGIAACTPAAPDEDKAKSAKCNDRTNNISCAACCQTENAVIVAGACACKGKPEAPK